MPAKPPKKAPKGVNTTGIKRLPRNLSRSDEKISDKELLNAAKIISKISRITMQIKVINRDRLNFFIITPIKKPVAIQTSSEGIRGCMVKLRNPN